MKVFPFFLHMSVACVAYLQPVEMKLEMQGEISVVFLHGIHYPTNVEPGNEKAKE